MSINKITRFVASSALLVAAFSAGQVVGRPADAATRHIDVNGRGVVTFSSLRHCADEDAGRNCTWNVDPSHPDGNGYGLAFRRGEHGGIHYVWPLGSKPAAGPYWQWVDQELADALAEGETRDDGTRHWAQCRVHFAATTTVECADGTWLRS